MVWIEPGVNALWRVLSAACADLDYQLQFIDLNIKCRILYGMNVLVIRRNP